MELLSNKDFNGLFFDIQKESVEGGDFVIYMRVTNLNDKKKKISIKTKYTSVEYGYVEPNRTDPVDIGYGMFLLPDSFVNARIIFYSTAHDIKRSHDGDRMELKINDGNLASLLLIRDKGAWYILDSKGRGNSDVNLKNRIEHFESIEEQCGIMLQNFSVRIVDENSINLFFEVMSLSGKAIKGYLKIEVAIYDLENNIVFHGSLSSSNFKGFEVYNFSTIKLDIPVDEIGKIRIYPVG